MPSETNAPGRHDPARRERWILDLLAELTDRAERRTASARVDDEEQFYEVAVAPRGRWSVHTDTTEWSGTPERLSSWTLTPVGALPRATSEPAGWKHPVVGMLWPHLLPIWGRVGDAFTPRTRIEGRTGLLMLPLEPTGGEVVGGIPLDSGATVEIDTATGLVTFLELPRRTFALLDVEER